MSDLLLGPDRFVKVCFIAVFVCQKYLSAIFEEATTREEKDSQVLFVLLCIKEVFQVIEVGSELPAGWLIVEQEKSLLGVILFCRWLHVEPIFFQKSLHLINILDSVRHITQ